MQYLFKWLYRTLSYFIPAGILLYTFVIENLMNKEITWYAKLGVSGIFVLVILIFVCIFIINNLFIKRAKYYEEMSIKEIDLEKRAEYIKKWNSVEKYHTLFKQCLILVVFICLTLLISLLETKLLALRGTMITICISFGVGTGFNFVYKDIEQKQKASKQEKE